MDTFEMLGKRYILPRKSDSDLFPDLFDAKDTVGEDRLIGDVFCSGMVAEGPVKTNHVVAAADLGDCLSGQDWMGGTEDLKKALLDAGVLQIGATDPPQFKVWSSGCFGLGGDEVIVKSGDLCQTNEGWRAVCALLPAGSGVQVTVIG